MRQGNLVHRQHQLGRRQQGIAAQRHRRGAGMRLDARQHHVVPALAQGGGYHADDRVGGFQHGALFDVRFEVGAYVIGRDAVLPRWRHGNLARIADGLQGLADAHALAVLLRQRMLQGEGPGIHARAHHHRHKARALFIGPHGQFQRRLGLHAMVIQRAQHFQPGQHAVVAVELAARGLSVDVAAGHDGGQVVVAARAAREDIADGVHAHVTAGLLYPAHEQVAPLAIQVGQGQAAHAAFFRTAYLRQIHQ
ncbi:hypothetical protein D3C73_861690 [compost metagenome]